MAKPFCTLVVARLSSSDEPTSPCSREPPRHSPEFRQWLLAFTRVPVPSLCGWPSEHVQHMDAIMVPLHFSSTPFSKKRAKGGASQGNPLRKTASDTRHLGTFWPLPPPYPISLVMSFRNPLNFSQVTSLETVFGWFPKMVSKGPSSRSFAFRYVLPPPPPLSSAQFFSFNMTPIQHIFAS